MNYEDHHLNMFEGNYGNDGNDGHYAQMVSDLAKPGQAIINELDAGSAHNLHMAIGIAGEAGELLDVIKKQAIYGKPLDREHVIEELGDIEFYMEGLRQRLNITRKDVLTANHAKLSKRYHQGKYSNSQARARADKEGEGHA